MLVESTPFQASGLLRRAGVIHYEAIGPWLCGGICIQKGVDLMASTRLDNRTDAAQHPFKETVFEPTGASMVI